MNTQTANKVVKSVTKEQFYFALMSENKDVILKVRHTFGTFYPCTTYFEYRHSHEQFGKEIQDRKNGIYETKYFLN